MKIQPHWFVLKRADWGNMRDTRCKFIVCVSLYGFVHEDTNIFVLTVLSAEKYDLCFISVLTKTGVCTWSIKRVWKALGNLLHANSNQSQPLSRTCSRRPDNYTHCTLKEHCWSTSTKSDCTNSSSTVEEQLFSHGHSHDKSSLLLGAAFGPVGSFEQAVLSSHLRLAFWCRQSWGSFWRVVSPNWSAVSCRSVSRWCAALSCLETEKKVFNFNKSVQYWYNLLLCHITNIGQISHELYYTASIYDE